MLPSLSSVSSDVQKQFRSVLALLIHLVLAVDPSILKPYLSCNGHFCVACAASSSVDAVGERMCNFICDLFLECAAWSRAVCIGLETAC